MTARETNTFYTCYE